MSKNLLNGISGNDVENLTTLIQKLEESSFNFLKIENQDLKIVIGKNGVIDSIEDSNRNGQADTLTAVKPELVQTPPHKEAAVTLEQRTQEEAPSKPNSVKDSAYEQEGIVTIKAVTAGLFYAQPEPGAAPYVKVGDCVEENSTVGLIEIMKVYSAISAGVVGEIIEIHVEDAQFVEYGQPLFSVKVK